MYMLAMTLTHNTNTEGGTMRITLSSEHGWTKTQDAKSLMAAKQIGTRALAHGCGDMTLETPGGTFVRRFWSESRRFGWDKWAQVG